MSNKYLLPFVTFTMKYFFDVERETTQQLIQSAGTKLYIYKELVSGIVTLHK